VAQVENSISGEQLLADWRMGEYDLSYLIIKHWITVLAPSMILTIGRFLRPRQVSADSQELIGIIRNSTERLRKMRFIASEVEKGTGPKIEEARGLKTEDIEQMDKISTPRKTVANEQMDNQTPPLKF
jgi:hypothetical protein